MADSFDVVVVGAGVFGAWCAYRLRKSGRRVALIDSYGVGNDLASSGDASRISRMGYGPDEIYTRWARESLKQWLELFDRAGQPELFQNSGVLWSVPPDDPRIAQSLATFEKSGVAFERLDHEELHRRYPQFRFPAGHMGVLEPNSGVLQARRAVQAVVDQAVHVDVEYSRAQAFVPEDNVMRTSDGKSLRATDFVFACGPWLAKIFPDLLGGRIRPTRQELFYFAVPDRSFSAGEMPAWIDFSDERGPYTVPDIDKRGLKLGFDRHGADFDPDTGNRQAHGVDEVREFLVERFPALANAPLVESRVCQYENTSNGDFLIDRHPDFPNVWLVGGGSGHGFKHGPMVGEYLTGRITGEIAEEPRFGLATKSRRDERAVY